VKIFYNNAFSAAWASRGENVRAVKADRETRLTCSAHEGPLSDAEPTFECPVKARTNVRRWPEIRILTTRLKAAIENSNIVTRHPHRTGAIG
jgi:hypothetical protein